ncbi:MAG TPA: (d)CMP kinase, partial [Smithella sp.]|nr:(d)CMP kinase [Smithella sp.]
ILAKNMNYIYLDTGALYRALAYKALKLKISLEDVSALTNLCSTTDVVLKNIDGQMKVFVDGKNVEEKIRTEEVSMAASKISTFIVVREKLLNLQRETGAQGGIVAEGRDMGSVVFPHADYKFYLDAQLDERIKRRYKELLDKCVSVEYQSIQKDMLARDKQDKQREIAPLKAPDDAVTIDSDNLTVEGVVDKIISYISIK